MVKKTLPIFLVIFAALIGSFALLHQGLLPTHDGEYHVVRFYEFAKVISGGVFFPRWAPDFNAGYGVPFFTFVYPLPNYVAALLHGIGFSFIDSLKLNMFLASIIGACFSYLWSKLFWGERGGIVASIFYTFSPYHFVDIYIRGSAGEVWALAFFPAFLWSITKLIDLNKKKYFVFSAVTLSAIIFSHNILALMFLPFAMVYIIFYMTYTKKWKGSFFVLASFLCGLTLSSIFWFPALFEKQYTVGLQIFDVTKNFPDLYQLLFPSWGSDFFGQGTGKEMSVQIGLANLFIIFLSLAILPFMVSKKKKELNIFLFFLLSFFTLVFLMLPVSIFFWKHIPFLNFFQFPWRFLSLVILISSFLAGSMVSFTSKKIVLVFFIILPVFLGIGYAKPAFYHMRNDSYYTSRSNFMDGTNSPGNAFNTKWFVLPPKNKKSSIIDAPEDISLHNVRKTVSGLVFNLTLQKAETVHLHLAFFPSWKVSMNKKEVNVRPDTYGRISFLAGKGTTLITIQNHQTTIETLGIFGFMLGIALILLLCLRDNFARIKK